jgi:hypothetical protein
MDERIMPSSTWLNLSEAAEHAALLKNNAALETKLRAQEEAQAQERIAKAAPYIEVLTHYDGGNQRKRLQRKPEVKTLRMYAEQSPWVRAAIDMYRDIVGRATFQLVPIDKERRVNLRVKKLVQDLLDAPNPAGEPWTLLMEKAVEDYLVVGHGPIEKKLRRDATPFQFEVLDAAHFGFYEGWKGDMNQPRYAILSQQGGVERSLSNEMAMVPTNRPRSYSELGLPHVETLHKTVMLLLAGDEFFLEQALDPSAQGILNLGPGFKKPQIDALRAEIEEVRKAFAIVSGPTKMNYVNFRLTEDQLRLLDTQTFYIRQVAAIFGISTAKLRLAVDTSRANTNAMLDDDLEGPASLLSRWEQMVNHEVIAPFGTPQETNLKIVYPILNQRDEQRQATISKIQVGGSGWIGINEAREGAGQERLNLPIANQPLIRSGSDVVPLEYLNQKFYTPDGKLKPLPEPVAAPVAANNDPAGDAAQSATTNAKEEVLAV